MKIISPYVILFHSVQLHTNTALNKVLMVPSCQSTTDTILSELLTASLGPRIESSLSNGSNTSGFILSPADRSRTSYQNVSLLLTSTWKKMSKNMYHFIKEGKHTTGSCRGNRQSYYLSRVQQNKAQLTLACPTDLYGPNQGLNCPCGRMTYGGWEKDLASYPATLHRHHVI